MKIGIISRFALMRASLTALMLQAGGFSVSADIASVDDLRRGLQVCPQVWLIHVAHAAELSVSVRRLHTLCPETPILALLNDCQLEIEAIKAGARGLVSWDSPSELFLKALQAVGHGEVWLSDSAAKEYIAHHLIRSASDLRRSSRITEREAEVLTIAASGGRSKEIANQLHMSVPTVRSHLRAIYRKLGVDNRVSAAFAYLRDLEGRAEGQTIVTPADMRKAPDTAAAEPAQTRSESGNKQTNKQTNKQKKQSMVSSTGL